MTESPLLLYLDPPLATVILNRPHRYNALNEEMQQMLPPMLDDLRAQSDIRVLIVRGAGGKAFAAGDDITQFVQWGAQEALAHYHHLEAFISAIENFPKPTIALIEGVAVGGGLEVAAACDLRIATAESRFGIPIARLGHTVDYPNALRLIRLIGPARVKEMLLTAELIDAAQAERIGLITRVLPADQIESYTYDLARKMAHLAPLSLQASKQVIQTCLVNPELRGIENPLAFAASLFDTEDFHRGVDAFLAKRPPQFLGR